LNSTEPAIHQMNVASGGDRGIITERCDGVNKVGVERLL